MKITNVKINLMPHQDPLKAFASITIDDCFVVHDLRVIKTENKLFVAMPSKKIKDEPGGKNIHKDIAHPINQTTRQDIEKAVIEEYHNIIKQMSE
ncbi:MAG: SpoVG family protein [Bdellovibrionales bacterium]